MLIAMDDADYAWMIGEGPGQHGLSIVEGGVAPAEVLAMLRGVQAGLAGGVDHPLAWMIVEQREVVGMVNLVARDADGRFELGFGVAPAVHGQGVMTRAIAELLPILSALALGEVTANTSFDNPASQRVLERNGFRQTGTKDDPEDGQLICWAATPG